jgi:hypothetical protein
MDLECPGKVLEFHLHLRVRYWIEINLHLNFMISYDSISFSSPEPFSLGHSLKIRLWVRLLKGEI